MLMEVSAPFEHHEHYIQGSIFCKAYHVPISRHSLRAVLKSGDLIGNIGREYPAFARTQSLPVMIVHFHSQAWTISKPVSAEDRNMFTMYLRG